jgi:hypothetical protein
MLDQTFTAGNRTFKTNLETLEVLRSVYNTDPKNETFKFVVEFGKKTGDIVEIS